MTYTSQMTIDVHIFEAFANQLSEDWIRKVAGKALSTESYPKPISLSLVIADDETVRDLNKNYRGFDETTNVLAFPMTATPGTGYDNQSDTFVIPDMKEYNLGEVIISFPQTIRQAKNENKPWDSELALLIIHGVLHLLGLDHSNMEQQEEMWAVQDSILSTIPAAG